jgi:hypothetical protein
MPTTQIEVAATTSPDLWPLGAGTSKVLAVNTPDDDDSSYIESIGGMGDKQQFSLSASGIHAGSTINTVSVYTRAKNVAGYCYIVPYLYLTGSSIDGATLVIPAYTWQSDLSEIARPGGGAWSISDLTSLEVGILNGYANNCRLSTLAVVVDWTPGTPPPTTNTNFLLLF